MDSTQLRTYGVIGTSALVCGLFLASLIIAYVSKDPTLLQLMIGVVSAQFANIVGYWVGSSAGSAQKDEQAAKSPSPPAPPPPPA